MKTSKKQILSLGIGLLIVMSFLSFRPILNPTLEDCKVIDGEILTIQEEGGPADITIQLKRDDHIYYVNRGMEKGLDPDDLNKNLADNKVTIHYAKHWTPLDPFGRHRHITRITNNGLMIYDEIKE